MKFEQLTLFDVDNKKHDLNKAKRKWETAFQKWSDEQSQDGLEPYGCCGFGSICDWCEDNSYGRPCVRAINTMCREKSISIDYNNLDFETVWLCGDQGVQL